jgi:hypothetical protein
MAQRPGDSASGVFALVEMSRRDDRAVPAAGVRGRTGHGRARSRHSFGEWTRPRLRNFREQCCDCGLIHRLDFRSVDGRIEFRTRRDNQ